MKINLIYVVITYTDF